MELNKKYSTNINKSFENWLIRLNKHFERETPNKQNETKNIYRITNVYKLVTYVNDQEDLNPV